MAFDIELAVVDTGQARGRFDQRIDEIGFVVVGHPLQDLGHPLEAQTGIDVLVGQRRERAFRITAVLHEHQVVELDEAAVVFQIDALIAQFRLEVVIDLGAGTARACGT